MTHGTAHRAVAMTAAAVVAASLGYGEARADEERLRAMKERGLEAYQVLEFEEARDIFSDALVYAKRHDLDDTELAARVHAKLGVVFFAGLEDENAAAIEFVNALEIDPAMEIDAAYRTREMQALFEEVRDELVGDAAASCPDISGIEHDLIDEAPAGQDRNVVAELGEDLDASDVVLYYRQQGTSEYGAVEMGRATSCTYQGTIPAEDMTGDYVYYYVAAERGGEPVATNGTEGTPNIIELTGDAGGGALADAAGGAPPGETGHPAAQDNVFVMLGAGTGGGYVEGQTEVAGHSVGCCFAPSILHAVPEVGVFINPQTTISVAGRIGFPLGADVGEGPATAAPGGVLRLRYVLEETGDGLAINFALGGGLMRNTVRLAEPQDGGETDTAASGPVIVGAGAGYSWRLGDSVQLVTELNLLSGIPVVSCIGDCGSPIGQGIEPGFALQADANLGLLLSF